MGLVCCDEQQQLQIRRHTADAHHHAITINWWWKCCEKQESKAYAQNQEMKWVPFIDFTNHMACFKIEQTVLCTIIKSVTQIKSNIFKMVWKRCFTIEFWDRVETNICFLIFFLCDCCCEFHGALVKLG